MINLITQRENLLALKKEEYAQQKHAGSPDEFYAWDYRYYDRIFVEKTLDLDDNLVKEYFPVDVVVPVILEIYQELLGVTFVEIKNDGKLWHPGLHLCFLK